MKTVGILYICTGKYAVFWPEFYRSFSANFLPELRREFFVFTDAAHIEGEGEDNVHRIPQKALPWPYSTLKRFSVFLGAEEALKKTDYLFFCNANLVCRERITPEEFLPRPEWGENLLLVQQPGFWNKKPMFYTYDRNPKSRAYIPYNCGRDYVSGGLNGGTTPAFLALCHELEARTEEDLAHGVIARWHDESQLNRYAAERSDYRLLSPAYWYPEGWQMPFPVKIQVLDKRRFFDVSAVKQDARGESPLDRKLETLRRDWLPYLWFLRDCILRKRL